MAYPGYGQPGGPPQGYPGGFPPGQPMAQPGAYPGVPGVGQPAGFPAGQPGYAAGFPGQAAADPLHGYFSAVAGQDQQIDALELQKCLTSSGISGNYTPFSLETCRLMINTLDHDYSGKMGFNEFKELWGCINSWKNTFMQYDRDRSGTCEPHELHQAVVSFGYNLTPQALNILVKRYSNNGRISLDDFMSCIIRLKALTAQFQRRDTARNGMAQFSYDEFIQTAVYY